MKKAIQINYDEHFERRCSLASKAGFEYISLGMGSVGGYGIEGQEGTETLENAVKPIKEILDKYNLSCPQTHLPYYDLRISAEIHNEKFEKIIENAIKVSGKIGAEWCVYHPRTAINYGYRRNDSLKRNKETVSNYLDFAVKYNTKIALENLPIFCGIIPIMPFYTSDYSDLCELTDSFNCEEVQCCWDFGHANMMAFDHIEALKFMGNRIKCTHIHNNKKRNDDHFPPDNGSLEWEPLMKTLKENGYKGPLTLEVTFDATKPEFEETFFQHNYVCIKAVEQLMK